MPTIIKDFVVVASDPEMSWLKVFDIHRCYKLPALPAYGVEDDPNDLPRIWRRRRSDKLRVCASVQSYQDNRPWLHVSFSFKSKTPTYADMSHVKAVFIGSALPAYMVMPRSIEHFNFHPHCLHLWSPLEGDDPLPDFLEPGGI